MSIDAQFDKRVRKVVKTHDRMRRNGVVHRIGRDGLIVSRPRLARPRFPLRGMMIIVLLGVLFKGLLWAQVGPSGYNDRVEALRAGNTVQQVGAWLLQEEAVTVWIGENVRPYLAR